MSDKRDIAVIGLGTFGVAVARELIRMGDRVVGVDRNPDLIAQYNGFFDSVVQADTTDTKVFEPLGIADFDSVIVAIGDDMQSSLLTTLGLKEAGVEDLHVKAQSPEHARILSAIGVKNLLHPESAFALRLSQTLHNPRVQDFISLRNGKIVAAYQAPNSSACKYVTDLKLKKYDLICVGIDNGERIISTDLENYEMSSTDILLLAGRRVDLSRFAKGG